MNLRRVFTAATLLVLLVATLFLTGCNTWRGAGKDVEHTGQKMQGK